MEVEEEKRTVPVGGSSLFLGLTGRTRCGPWTLLWISLTMSCGEWDRSEPAYTRHCLNNWAPFGPKQAASWVLLRGRSPERIWMHSGVEPCRWSCRKTEGSIPHRSYGSWLGVSRFRAVCPGSPTGQCYGLLLCTDCHQSWFSLKGSSFPLLPPGKDCSGFQQ